MKTINRIARRILSAAALAAIAVATSQTSIAQSFNGDARIIGMGSVDSQSNPALSLAGPRQHRYRSVVVPLGLFQVLKDPGIFNPSDDRFNPVRALKDIASPLHFTFNRNGTDAGERLVKDLIEGNFNRDLTAYRGFTPPPRWEASGLLSPSWGKTFRIGEDGSGISQAIYAGAGPYISIGTDLHVDPKLIELLSEPVRQSEPDAHFAIGDSTQVQGAAAITGGYRIRLPLPGRSVSPGRREGLYVAVNYNYLRGLHYESADMNARFDTDSDGLVTLDPSTVPVVVDRLSSGKGHGFGMDFATGFIMGRWEGGFAAQGIANRIEWEDLRAERLTLSSILDGSNFESTDLPSPLGSRRTSLPTRYSANASYNADSWSVETSYGHGLQHADFRSGLEYRRGSIALRGGGRYSRGMWNPSGGVGFNLSEGFGVDIAAFGNSVNLEQQRKAALAVSLRFNH